MCVLVAVAGVFCVACQNVPCSIVVMVSVVAFPHVPYSLCVCVCVLVAYVWSLPVVTEAPASYITRL